jgi:integrase/recombinase XerC
MPRKTTQPATPRPVTWTTALTRFFAHLVEEERSEHTRKNYREDLLAFTAWYQTTFQERPDLKALAPAELREWKAHLRDDRHLEPRTVNRKLAALRSFLTWAADAGLAAEIHTPKSLRQIPPPPRWLDRKEQRALLRAVDRFGGSRDGCLVRLLIHTGIRVEEAVALRWNDITIRERSGTLIVRRGKGRKQRSIPLNAEARAALTELRHIAPRRSAEVLHGQRGPLTVRGLQAALARYGPYAKLEECTPHVLRHTFGKNLADAGTPIQVIADLMGHESLETTRRYVQPGHDDLAAAVERIGGGSE